MKKFLKAVSVMLTLAMLFGVVSFADDGVRIYSDEEIAVSNDGEVVVPFYIGNNSGITSFDISVEYDREVIEPIEDSEEIGEVMSMVLVNPSYMSKAIMRAAGMNSVNVDKNGLLFSYKFRIKNADIKETALTISSAIIGSLADDYTVKTMETISGEDVQLGRNAIKISVEGGATIPTPTTKPNGGGAGGSGGTVTPAPTVEPTEDPAAASAKIKADAKDIKYMAAVSETEFAPDRAATRYEVVEALYALTDFENLAKTENTFSDVDEAHKDMVEAFVQTGIVAGYTDGTFGGEKNVTRAEFVKLLSATAGIEADSTLETEFTDINGHWGEGYIKAFVDSGFIYGYPDKTFLPDNNVTRAEAVAIINRLIGKKAASSETSKFDDIVEHWAFGDIESAVK